MEEHLMQVFENNEFGKIEVVQDGDKFYFPATKCAKILGYKNPEKAVRDHCKGVNESFTPSAGGTQKTKLIPEGDLYRLIVRSKLESAQRFESWVFDEVIPSIRKNSAYILPELLDELQHSEEKANKLISVLAAEQRQNRVLEKKLDEVKPQLHYLKTILDNPTTLPMTAISKDYGMSAKKLNEILCKCKIQYCRGGVWYLYQEYATRGYTQSAVIRLSSGRQVIHTKWTQKGREFLYNFLKDIGVVPLIEKEVC